MNYKQIYAMKNVRLARIKKLLPTIEHRAGIYKFSRVKDGKVCTYIGQSVDVWERCASHLAGYKTKNPSHIDKSLFKHKLASEVEDGWRLDILIYCDKERLNYLEQRYIEEYRKIESIEMYNVTIGSQGKGKVNFQERNNEQLKRYANGKIKGKTKVLNEIRAFFDKYLDFTIKGKPNKIKERKLKEFKELLYGTETISSETKD